MEGSWLVSSPTPWLRGMLKPANWTWSSLTLASGVTPNTPLIYKPWYMELLMIGNPPKMIGLLLKMRFKIMIWRGSLVWETTIYHHMLYIGNARLWIIPLMFLYTHPVLSSSWVHDVDITSFKVNLTVFTGELCQCDDNPLSSCL